jgi:hypothetical protein
MERMLSAVKLVACASARTVFTRFIPPVTADEMPGVWKAYYRKWSRVTRGVMDDALGEQRWPSADPQIRPRYQLGRF